MAVDTRKVSGRRKLHFETIEEIQQDVDRLVAGEVKHLGNWSLAQVLSHLAFTMNSSIDGTTFTPAFWLRFFGPLMKKRYLTKPMPAGFKLPENIGYAFLPEAGITQDGALVKFRHALKRLQHETHRARHPVFGDMTLDEWNQLHMRHAELHLSFIVPAASVE
jgi:hypothetical protein